MYVHNNGCPARAFNADNQMMDYKKYKIEKNIPVPPAARIVWEKIVREMNVSDSVIFDSSKEAQRFIHAMQYRNKTVCQRREISSDGIFTGKYRVWRIK